MRDEGTHPWCPCRVAQPALVLAACGNEQGGGGDAGGGTKASKIKHVAASYSEKTQGIWEDLIQRFEQQNAGTDVELQVIDSITNSLPIADIPQHNAGLTFDEAMTCLAVFARHEGLAGLIITEFNPDHGAEDGSTADPLVRGLVGALTG